MSPALPLTTLAIVNILQPYNHTAELNKEKAIEELKYYVFSAIKTKNLKSCEDASNYCNQFGDLLKDRCLIPLEGVLCDNFTTDDDFKGIYYKVEEFDKRVQENIDVVMSKANKRLFDRK